MFKEFKEFLTKFNVIPAAVGLVLALAIKPVIDTVVSIIMQIVAKAAGSNNPAKAAEAVELGGINFGAFITATVSFVIVAFVVFMIVKSLNKAGAQTTAAQTADQALLTEIRDLLRSQQR